MVFPDIADPYLGLGLFIFVLIVIWSLIWKGFALWKAAKKNSPVWFIVLLVVNTLGILEILYLYVFSEMGKKKSQALPKRKRRR